jgi:hypothetical protein
MRIELSQWVKTLPEGKEGRLSIGRARLIARSGRIPSARFEFGRWTCDASEPDPRFQRGKRG